MTVAVDWDDTCIDVTTGEWLPGAVQALRALAKSATVTIHTCRVYDAPRIRRKLDEAGLRRIRIHEEPGKPVAMLYIDDRALRFTGWATTFGEAKRLIHEHIGR